FDLETGTTTPLTDGTAHAFDPRLDEDGAWLTYTTLRVGEGGQGSLTVVARNLQTGDERSLDSMAVGSPSAPSALRVHEWVGGGRLAVLLKDRVSVWIPADGFFEMPGITLAAGSNVLIARAADPAGGAKSPNSEPVVVTVAPATFPDLAIAATDLSSY